MSSGDYYLRKTKDYFKEHGWSVDSSEYKYKIPHTKFWRKKDVLASDFIAWCTKGFVLVNVTTKTNVSKHVKRYEDLCLPPFIEWAVIYWKKGARLPTIRRRDG